MIASLLRDIASRDLTLIVRPGSQHRLVELNLELRGQIAGRDHTILSAVLPFELDACPDPDRLIDSRVRAMLCEVDRARASG